jgi:hypothetical protein
MYFREALLIGDLHPRRELSALPTVLRTEIVTGPKISSLDIQAWIRDTEAPVFKLRGMLDETDSWHFGRLVATLQNNHTVSRPSHWLPAHTVLHCDSTLL